RLMKLLKHPHIINVQQFAETTNEILLMMEYASAGDLFEYILVNKKCSEQVARDLKPENILLDGKGYVKVSDFGFGNTYHKDKFLQTHCGSPYYAAPEVVNRRQYTGPEIDIWSIGIILYALLSGGLPFQSPTNNNHELFQMISKGTFARIPNISEEAHHLVCRILTVDAKKRARMDEIMNHPWVTKTYNCPPHSYLLPRPSTVPHPNPDAVLELVSYGISEHDIRNRLLVDTGLHPIKSLYFLVEDSLRASKWKEMYQFQTKQMHGHRPVHWASAVTLPSAGGMPPLVRAGSVPVEHSRPIENQTQ
ncbi:hypothetical protein HDV05_001374, partial [Chytridiales sp. JEL 0842]